MLRNLLPLFAVVLCAVVLCAAAHAAERSNIVMVLADDLQKFAKHRELLMTPDPAPESSGKPKEGPKANS